MSLGALKHFYRYDRNEWNGLKEKWVEQDGQEARSRRPKQEEVKQSYVKNKRRRVINYF